MTKQENKTYDAVFGITRRMSHWARLLSLACLVVLFFAFASSGVMAQPSVAPRIEVQGVECWVHTVKKKETLYAISRLYGVSQTEIAARNPDIYYGIKKGQKLLIPIPQELR